MAAPIRVAVCGVPSSGNRLVRNMLNAHGCECLAFHFGTRKDWRLLVHGDDSLPEGDPWREPAGRVRVILPLRDVAANEASLRSKAERPGFLVNDHATSDSMHLSHWRPTLEMAAGYPCLPVRYEDIVAEPELWGQAIADFAGVTWGGWRVEIRDGNAKWLSGE